MSSTIPRVEGKTKVGETSAEAKSAAIERRRRRRAKISAQVHVKATNSPEPFEEVCMSIDVSRDGLLFTAKRAGYWKGQQLDVTFPFSTAAAALNTAQVADIVRVSEQPGGKFQRQRFAGAGFSQQNERFPRTGGKGKTPQHFSFRETNVYVIKLNYSLIGGLQNCARGAGGSGHG